MNKINKKKTIYLDNGSTTSRLTVSPSNSGLTASSSNSGKKKKKKLKNKKKNKRKIKYKSFENPTVTYIKKHFKKLKKTPNHAKLLTFAKFVFGLYLLIKGGKITLSPENSDKIKKFMLGMWR